MQKTRPSFSAVTNLPLLLLLLLGIEHQTVLAKFLVPGLAKRQFVQKGDINIGVLMGMSSPNSSRLCTDVRNPGAERGSQLIAYAVEQVNKERLLPNNLTLGFAVLDDCYSASASVAQSMAFVPQTFCAANAHETTSTLDVVAVIGSTYTAQSIAASQLLGAALVPVVSVYSTSDDLSNKDLFPYFMRTVPPNKFQFQAIFSIIRKFGWSYVSVIYNEGSYGENGFRQLRNLFDQHGICLAAVHKVADNINEEEAETVAKELVAHRNARIVVMVTTHIPAYSIITAITKLAPAGSFIWMATNAWSGIAPSWKSLGDYLLDAFLVEPLMTSVPEYEDWFSRLKLTDTTDPWFAEFWENLFNCSIAGSTCNETAIVADGHFLRQNATITGHYIDTVSMIANATSRVLQREACEGLKGSAARGCITGPRLLREMLATRQNGYTGWLELDSNGDRLGRYIIRQIGPDSAQVFTTADVAEFDSMTGLLTMMSDVVWTRQGTSSDLVHPESKCSYPCGPHEARVVQEVTCCWLCQLCRDNERLIRNGTRCEACPTFSWPDPVTYNSTCLPIPPDRPRVNSVMGVVQTSLAILCLLACLVVFVFFHCHRQCRVIKASSRELSMLILLAIATGYVVIGTLVAPPTDFTCRLNFLLFCMSFTLIYGPLLVRALRIFRIFEASKMSARRPRMIDSSHQLIFSFAFLSIQLVICIVMMMVHPTWHKLTQSSSQEHYVELACDLPMTGLVSFLAYNLLLVAVCTVLAFKTRHLPDNFNESRFISMCVSTKLVILLCFIPAYLVSGRELLKMQMLALVVALNHSVALIFLFLPKIYAVLYLEGAADINQTTMHRGGTVGMRTQISMISSTFPGIGESHREGGDSEQSGPSGSNRSDSRTSAPNFRQVAPAP